MTEEEARKRVCPMARTAKPGQSYHCIASDCMMWRRDSQTTGYCGLAGRPAV